MYKVGEYVHYKLDEPEDALGYKEKDKRFREMDNRASKFPKKIVKVLPYPAGTRYVLEGLPNVSSSENELRLSKDQSFDKKVVQDIVGKKKVGKQVYWLVWWKGEPKKDATWEKEQDIYNETHLLMKRYEYEHAVILDKRTKNSKLECLVQWFETKKKDAEWVPYQKIKVILQKPLYEYDKKHGLLGDDELEEDSNDSDSDDDIEEDEEDDKKIFNEINKRKQKIYHDIEVEKKQKTKKALKKPKKPAKSKSKNKRPKSKEPQIKQELDEAPEGRLLRSAKVKQNPKQQQH